MGVAAEQSGDMHAGIYLLVSRKCMIHRSITYLPALLLCISTVFVYHYCLPMGCTTCVCVSAPIAIMYYRQAVQLEPDIEFRVCGKEPPAQKNGKQYLYA